MYGCKANNGIGILTLFINRFIESDHFVYLMMHFQPVTCFIIMNKKWNGRNRSFLVLSFYWRTCLERLRKITKNISTANVWAENKTRTLRIISRRAAHRHGFQYTANYRDFTQYAKICIVYYIHPLSSSIQLKAQQLNKTCAVESVLSDLNRTGRWSHYRKCRKMIKLERNKT